MNFQTLEGKEIPRIQNNRVSIRFENNK